MQLYTDSLTKYSRLKTREVNVGGLIIGNYAPVRIQTMTTTDTMDTNATVEQTIRCVDAGAELVRITAPSKNEAENLLNIKNELRRRGYTIPLVADIHFTPNAAEIAARLIEKVRVNPGNYADKKKFDFIEYTDKEYLSEIERIRNRFRPLVKICKEYGTAMRIGTNHGSLSDRIMSRYGDTAMGMVESAMEFLRIARDEQYHNIVLSMKSSNPLVMVQAYRLLVQTMFTEFSEIYPLHLGVTEAGDGEDGRIKSALGIGTLMEDGIGDTIRVSLTEDPEFEIPVCRDIVDRFSGRAGIPVETLAKEYPEIPTVDVVPYSPFNYQRRRSAELLNIGGSRVPVVVADFMAAKEIIPESLMPVGYQYDSQLDKWHLADAAADFIYTGTKIPDFALPGSLRIICDQKQWSPSLPDSFFPLFTVEEFLNAQQTSPKANFISVDCYREVEAFPIIEAIKDRKDIILCLWSSHPLAMAAVRRFMMELMNFSIESPVIIAVESNEKTIDEQLINFSSHAGALLVDGLGDGLWLMNDPARLLNARVSGRTYLEAKNNHQFLNNTAFSILQAARTRISKTEYISCPSCGRTLFDLQETTARIRAATGHLKGVKIAIMGCIVNGPGEMADADFGYVGSGPGKITLYKGREVIEKSVSSDIAVEKLLALLKDNGYG